MGADAQACWKQYFDGRVMWMVKHDDLVRYLSAERELQEAEAKIRRLRHLLGMHTRSYETEG